MPAGVMNPRVAGTWPKAAISPLSVMNGARPLLT